MDDRQRELVEQSGSLVEPIARTYVDRGLSLEALVEAGKSGLANAAEQFDPSRGYKFSTYATWWIRDAITKALAQIPEAPAPIIDLALAEQTRRILRTLTPREEEVLRQRFGVGDKPAPEEVGQDFEATRERIREIERRALAQLEAPRRARSSNDVAELRRVISDLGSAKRARLRKLVEAGRDPPKAIARTVKGIDPGDLKKLVLRELDRFGKE